MQNIAQEEATKQFCHDVMVSMIAQNRAAVAGNTQRASDLAKVHVKSFLFGEAPHNGLRQGVALGTISEATAVFLVAQAIVEDLR